MDETFWNMRSWWGLAVNCAAGVVVLAPAALLYIVLADPTHPHSVWAALFFGGFYLVMGGFWLWFLLDYWRGYVRINGDRIISRGAVRTREILFADVTELRWHRSGRLVVIVGGAERIRIDHNDNLTREERTRIVHYLRGAVPSEVQTGWTMFAYRFGVRKSGAGPRKPGPDEVLMTPERQRRFLDWVFAPTSLLAGIIGVFLWWTTGELRRLTAPVPLVVLWGLMRVISYWDSAQPSVQKDMSVVFWTERGRYWRFTLVWCFVGLVGLFGLGWFKGRLLFEDGEVVVGTVVWAGVFVYESWLHSRVQARVDLEEAELAAKERGERTHGSELNV